MDSAGFLAPLIFFCLLLINLQLTVFIKSILYSTPNNTDCLCSCICQISTGCCPGKKKYGDQTVVQPILIATLTQIMSKKEPGQNWTQKNSVNFWYTHMS